MLKMDRFLSTVKYSSFLSSFVLTVCFLIMQSEWLLLFILPISMLTPIVIMLFAFLALLIATRIEKQPVIFFFSFGCFLVGSIFVSNQDPPYLFFFILAVSLFFLSMVLQQELELPEITFIEQYPAITIVILWLLIALSGLILYLYQIHPSSIFMICGMSISTVVVILGEKIDTTNIRQVSSWIPISGLFLGISLALTSLAFS